ncbi:MAG: TIR domain-containing protein, partial [Pseudomonadota bacterium]
MATKPFPAYQGDDPYVFVSYSHEDAAAVYHEIERLSLAGVNIWYDEGIGAGTRWSDELASAITCSAVMVCFVTPRSVTSRHCQDEISYALDRDIPVIAVHLEDTELPPGLSLRLSTQQAILVSDIGPDRYLGKLLQGLSNHIPIEETIEDAGTRRSQTTVLHAGQPRRWGLMSAVATIVLLITGTVIYLNLPTSSVLPPPESAIAVLPFDNMSSDSEHTFFGDGVSEEILNALVRTNTVPVIARMSSFQFRGQNLNVIDVAEELSVSHVVQGSVRRSGNQVRVTAQLIDGSSGVQLWSAGYDGELNNILKLQTNIAEQIVEEIRAELPGTYEQPQLAQRPVVNPDAYLTYLEALHHHRRYTKQSTERALSLLDVVTQIDPELTQAWMLKAQILLMRPDQAPRSNLPEIKQALDRALALDPEHPFALATLGTVTAALEYDWETGTQYMDQAIAAGDRSSELLMLQAYTAMIAGDNEDVFRLFEQAYRLNPLSAPAALIYATFLEGAERRVEAQLIIDEFQSSGRPPFNAALVEFYLNTQQLEDAEAALARYEDDWGITGSSKALRWRIAHARGDTDTMSAIQQELLTLMATDFVPGNSWGLEDTLLVRMKQSVDNGELYSVGNVWSLRHLPEYRELYERMNLDTLEAMNTGLSQSRVEASRIHVSRQLLDQY